jgi:hypothetical protein
MTVEWLSGWSREPWRVQYDLHISLESMIETNISQIQELNYRITVSLNSDSKSEVEGVRWVLTRRSVMGILFMAFIILSSLRFASIRSHEEEQRKKKEAERKLPRMVDELSGPSAAEILAAG